MQTLAQLAAYLQGLGPVIEQNLEAAALANAQLLGSRIRGHILRDDLPLTALSTEWVREKLSQGKNPQHLWFTGEYLANFDIQPTPKGQEVGTRREAPGFPSAHWESLPELLEDRYPVWQLTLDELEGLFERNFGEAIEAALDQRKPRFINQ